MESNHDPVAGFGGAANKLAKLLAETAGLFIEPAKIRRVAEAKADESRILTDAEIQKEELLSSVRYRIQVMELRRQKNLEAIASLLAMRKGPDFAIEDQDFLVEFVEAAKDTSDPTLQDIWAKLLAGEMEMRGSCSKRTLHMVKSLSRDEALLIKEVGRRVCVVEEHDGTKAAFLTVYVFRRNHVLGEDEPARDTLYADDAPLRRARDERLQTCGFLTTEDYKFTFGGEGPVKVEEFHLSQFSAKKIEMGPATLTADRLQPGLLMPPTHHKDNGIRFLNGPVDIEVDAWRLSAEGVELFHALNAEPDLEFLAQLHQALADGGLAVSRNK